MGDEHIVATSAPSSVGHLTKSTGVRSGTVLVTGGGGFVGSAVVRELVRRLQRTEGSDRGPVFADGSPVTRVVAMLRPVGSSERLSELAPSQHWAIARASLTDVAGLAALVSDVKPRAILHLAMETTGLDDGSEARLRDTIDRPLQTLYSVLRETPGARLVSTGSAAVLRPGDAMGEDAPIEANPAYLLYARAKIREESVLACLGATTGVQWLHLRLFFTFGKYEAPARLLPHIVRHVARGEPADLSYGDQVRDFTDVEDVAAAYVHALGVGEGLCRRPYHIGSGRGLSVRHFAEIVADIVGRRELLHFGAASPADRGQSVIVADVTRARRDLGWIASADTPAMIRRAAAWWLARLHDGA